MKASIIPILVTTVIADNAFNFDVVKNEDFSNQPDVYEEVDLPSPSIIYVTVEPTTTVYLTVTETVGSWTQTMTVTETETPLERSTRTRRISSTSTITEIRTKDQRVADSSSGPEGTIWTELTREIGGTSSSRLVSETSTQAPLVSGTEHSPLISQTVETPLVSKTTSGFPSRSGILDLNFGISSTAIEESTPIAGSTLNLSERYSGSEESSSESNSISRTASSTSSTINNSSTSFSSWTLWDYNTETPYNISENSGGNITGNGTNPFTSYAYLPNSDFDFSNDSPEVMRTGLRTLVIGIIPILAVVLTVLM